MRRTFSNSTVRIIMKWKHSCYWFIKLTLSTSFFLCFQSDNLDYFYHKEHLFIVCELLRDNLYEFYKYNRESGDEFYFNLERLKRITKQCLIALDYIHSLNLIHCDLKPENILIKSYSRYMSIYIYLHLSISIYRYRIYICISFSIYIYQYSNLYSLIIPFLIWNIFAIGVRWRLLILVQVVLHPIIWVPTSNRDHTEHQRYVNNQSCNLYIRIHDNR